MIEVEKLAEWVATATDDDIAIALSGGYGPVYRRAVRIFVRSLIERAS